MEAAVAREMVMALAAHAQQLYLVSRRGHVLREFFLLEPLKLYLSPNCKLRHHRRSGRRGEGLRQEGGRSEPLFANSFQVFVNLGEGGDGGGGDGGGKTLNF